MNKPSFVSVIMPVRNEADFIAASLKAVLIQDYYPGRLEILVVDGLSSDGTREIVTGVSGEDSRFPVQLLVNASQTVPIGMNLALKRARGDVIIRVDGHTVIARDYVGQCVEALQRSRADNVGGRMNAAGTTPFGKVVALATSTPFGIGGGRFHYSEQAEWVDTVYMGAWPRHVFEKIGLFDEELVRDQDDEFNYRLRENGGKILLRPEIKSEYAVRSAPGALWRQYFQYGFWKVRVLQKHPRQMSLRHFIPPVFVFSLFISFLLLFSSIFRAVSVVIPLLYIAANLTASIYTASRRGWKYLPLLPVTFVILHHSYGLGFLAGLIKFRDRWADKTGKTPVWTNESIG